MQSQGRNTIHFPEFSTSYENIKCLGKGNFGLVYHVRLVSGIAVPHIPDEIAVKITISPMSTDDLDKLRTVISLIKHPNVLTMYCCTVLEPSGFEQLKRTAILMEFCQGGSLKDQIERGMCYTEAIEYSRQVTDGLAFLHSKNIVHMDLKPANVLLSERHTIGIYMVAKLADVDNPVILAHTVTSSSDALGPHSLRYCSPEIKQKKRDEKSLVGRMTDIWSLGYLIHDLIFGDSQCSAIRAEKPVFIRAKDGSVIERGGFVVCADVQGARTTHSHMCERLITFLQRCLIHDPKGRDQAYQLAKSKLLAAGPTFNQLLDPNQPLWNCGHCQNQNSKNWIEQGKMKCPTSTLSDSQNRRGGSPNDPGEALQSAVKPIDSAHVKFLADHPITLTHNGETKPHSYDHALSGSLLLGLQEACVTSVSFSRIRVENWIRVQSLTLTHCSLTSHQDFLLGSTSLKTLTMDFHENSTSWRSGMLGRLQLPNLAELTLNFTGDVELGNETLEHLPNLGTLYLSFAETVNCKDLVVDSTSVEDLIITANENPDISLCMFLVPNLLHLHLLAWPKRTSKIDGFAYSTPKLTRILVRSCSSTLVSSLLQEHWPHLQDFCISPVTTSGKPCSLRSGTTEQRKRLDSWPRSSKRSGGQRRPSDSDSMSTQFAAGPGGLESYNTDKPLEDYFWLEKHFTFVNRLTRYVYTGKEGNNTWHAKQAPSRGIVEYVSFVRGFRHILECGHCCSNVKPLQLAGQEMRVLFCGKEHRRRFH